MTSAPQNGVYRTDRPEVVCDAARARGLEVVSIKVSDTEKGELLSQIARALEFPAWFGGNWDALEDCLCDLSWREAQGTVLLFENIRPGSDFGVLADILASAAEYWTGRGKIFLAVFIDPQRRLALPDYPGERA
jgi:hypothetical protein